MQHMGERKLLQSGTHIPAAFTEPNNDQKGGLQLRPDKYRLIWDYELQQSFR
jgi:hypothetical protein